MCSILCIISTSCASVTLSETVQISKRQDLFLVQQAPGFRFQFSAEDFEHALDEIMAYLWVYDVKSATVMIQGT
jgi:hypothetical protein